MLDPDDLKRHLAEGMECTHLEVQGDGRHFQALVVSPAFVGLNRVKRHQYIYQVLGTQMRDEAVHALSLTTLTPEEWRTHG